jgi:23S rRNA (adenine2503-C2)-methyltransferase
MAVDVKALTREELASQFEQWRQPAYRVDQLLHWLYERRAPSWDTMSNLPKQLREQLKHSVHAHNIAVGAQARVARHDAEIPVAAWRWIVH